MHALWLRRLAASAEIPPVVDVAERLSVAAKRRVQSLRDLVVAAGRQPESCRGSPASERHRMAYKCSRDAESSPFGANVELVQVRRQAAIRRAHLYSPCKSNRVT